ncbi:hypothetical protein ACQKND_22435 [Viridibacillus arvi]|uniref:hypothetical protein n=1 Tax=Viridibacillus arvi TaxID=263475 RepID=UPI003CFE5E33
MKKVLLSFAFVGTLLGAGLFNGPSAFAAADSSPKGVDLSSDQTTDTSSRIKLSSGQQLNIFVANYWYSNHQIQYSIFKDGNEYVTNLVDRNGIVNTWHSWAAGEYSIRLYCNTQANRLTGCQAGAKLTVK